MSVCSRRGQRVQEKRDGGGGLLSEDSEHRSNQEKGRFESLSDFLLPLLCSGHKLI